MTEESMLFENLSLGLCSVLYRSAVLLRGVEKTATCVEIFLFFRFVFVPKNSVGTASVLKHRKLACAVNDRSLYSCLRFERKERPSHLTIRRLE